VGCDDSSDNTFAIDNILLLKNIVQSTLCYVSLFRLTEIMKNKTRSSKIGNFIMTKGRKCKNFDAVP